MASFRNSFFVVQRPKAIYNQVTASLWKSILGTKWFSKVQEGSVLQLDSQEKMNEIKAKPENREIIRKNVLYWLSQKKTVIQWYCLFQVCLEFEFVNEWNLLWQQKNKFKWSEQEEALFLCY